MIKVTVRSLGAIRYLAGSREVEIQVRQNCTVRDALSLLSKKRGKILRDRIFDHKTNDLKPDIRLLLNGQNIALLNGVETRVKDGDVITILPSAGGG
jgi:MoaD family protein